jgi:hypothetical protein
MLQAFAYHHLVPVSELKVVIAGRVASNTTVRVLSPTPVKIPAGGTGQVRMGVPAGTFFEPVHVELDEPPEGITVQKETPGPEGTEIVLHSDRAKVKPGLKGNLILNAFAAKSQESGTPKPQASQRPTPLGMLPALPYEIVDRP